MSKNGRQNRTFSWGHWNEVDKTLGIKRKGNINTKKNDDKRATQRKKFAKCKICGNQMTYVPGSNILVCENEVEKTVTTNRDDGTTEEKVEKKRCGNINLIADQYLGYAKYLFED